MSVPEITKQSTSGYKRRVSVKLTTAECKMLWAFVFATALTYYLYWIFVVKRHPPGFPPGPRFPLPLVGDWASLATKPTLNGELRKKYGGIYGYWGSSKRNVVVTDFSLIQVLKNHTYSMLYLVEFCIF